MEGLEQGPRGQAGCETDKGIEMRPFACQEQRMLRALHVRWPMRRSHYRDELHWLACMRARGRWCLSGRVHLRRVSVVHRRRAHGG
jgi:hypothetical protein